MNNSNFKGFNIIIPLLAMVIACGMGSVSATSQITDTTNKTQTNTGSVDLNNSTSSLINSKSNTTTSLQDVTNPKVIKTDPINNKVNVALGKVIKIYFTENITKNTVFDKIILRNKNGLIVPITKSINGNLLIVKKKAGTFQPASKYTLYLPYNSIRDKSGNSIQNTFKSSFTTIGVPNIKLTSLITPSKGNIGKNIVINSTIKNNSSASSKSSYIKFYLTPTKNSNGKKYYIGQRLLNKQVPGTYSTKNSICYISVKVPVGSYYLVALEGKTVKGYSIKKMMVTIPSLYPDGWVSVNGLTYYSQPNGYSCGPSSLKMVLSNYELNISESWLERVAGSSYGGTSHSGLINAVYRVNQLYKTSFSAWDESFSSIRWAGLYTKYISKNSPVILHVHSWFNANGGHYVVLAGLNMNKKMVMLADPSYGGYRIVSFSELENRMQWVVDTGRTSKPVIAIVNNT
jgi:hypothetical protein